MVPLLLTCVALFEIRGVILLIYSHWVLNELHYDGDLMIDSQAERCQIEQLMLRANV